MPTQLMHAIRERAEDEITELKQPLHRPVDPDETMSEWELARHQSKTWSMEQD